MGNSISSWGGQKRVAGIINKAGLPLQIAEGGPEEDTHKPLSPFTEAYNASGWFTGVRSSVTVPATPNAVYTSLSKDLQNVFTPMSECDDELREEGSDGAQSLFRVVRIPFRVAFVTGNLKLRLNVEQNPNTRKVHFESAQEGRLITKFLADFNISPKEGEEGHTVVNLDAKVDCKSLPPPPFKSMVKDVMVSKMDSCMMDLVAFHSHPAPGAVDVEVDATEQPALTARGSGRIGDRRSRKEAGGGFEGRPSEGFLSTMRRTLSSRLSSRRSFEKRKSLEKQRQSRVSLERLRGFKSETRKHAPLPPRNPESGGAESNHPGGRVSVFAGWQGGLEK